MWILLFLLLPVAALSGWYAGFKSKSTIKNANPRLPRDYFIGLQYLINEQPDKAVDVFVKMLEVNSDTVETHLALGSLFRRKGEVNRAIRVHQNLIARPQLTKEERSRALAELAKDYMRAGVLDRAEKLFLELVNIGGDTLISYQCLLNIYEQQKDWEQAIAIARKLENAHRIPMHTNIAHYFCELNEPGKAILVDRNCVRASLLEGQKAAKNNNFKLAIRSYKKIIDQDADYISEVIQPLSDCYLELNSDQDLISYLYDCLLRFPRISIILTLAGYIRKYQGDFAAIEFITKQMEKYPSLRGLNCLTRLYIDNAEGNTKHKLTLLHEVMAKLLENKPVYQCKNCGFSTKSLYWHCPGCKRWGTVKPIHGLEGD